jgi:two-component system, chemotaxis family, CheB/CheR fusion protein
MPYRSLDNRIEGVVMTFSDITAAMNLESELRETGTMLRTPVQAAPFLFICLSAEGRILEFNPEAEKLLCRSRDTTIGLDFFEMFLPEQDRSQALASMKVLLAASPATKFTTRVTAADGMTVAIEWSARRLSGDGGETSGIIAIGQDIAGRTIVQ